jgi:hypothetical protein
VIPARIRLLALVDGAGTGAYLAATSILLTTTAGPAAAGTALAIGATGRVAALVWLSRLTRTDAPATTAHRAYLLATALMVGGGIAGLWAASVGAALAVGLLGIISGAGNNLTSTLAATARDGQMVSFYPLLMLGGAGGAAVAATVLARGLPLWLLTLLLAAQLIEPILIRPYQRLLRARPALTVVTGDALKGAALAAASYGPLTAYAVLVTTAHGPRWVGPAMAAYAAGATLAAPLDRHLSTLSARYRQDRWGGTVLLAAAGALTWAAGTTVAGVLAGRAAAGTLMFLAQGRLLRSVFETTGGSAARAAATSTGLGVGAGAGGIIAVLLAQSRSLPAMALTLALATCATLLIDRRTGPNAR